jgi:flagellin
MSMSLVVNTNTEAMVAQNNLANTEQALSAATTDLSSGLRINTAADDAAGYAITEDLTAQVNGLGQAQQNAQDAVSLVQTADGTLNDVEQMLQRINELAVQYNNGTNDSQDLNAIQCEVDQLTAEIARVGSTAQFNGINLFTGNQTITFQVGANDGETISVKTSAMSSLVSSSISLSSGSSISAIDTMINNVSEAAAQYGAVQNRLSYTLDNLMTYQENLTSAQSSIQDVDMASEMTTFTSQQVLEQSGISMLSQAQQQPQLVLKLLQA